MKLQAMKSIRNLLKAENGQTLIFVVLGMFTFLGLGGVTLDVGHAYYALHELQDSTNSAAMAGAMSLPDPTAASNAVNHYSSISGGTNTSINLRNAAIVTETPFCSTTVQSSLDIPCLSMTGTGIGYNAIVVKQSAQVPLWFGKLAGIPVFNIAATATAATDNKIAPLNIALIIDTTSSMSDPDPACSGKTQLQCALNGAEIMLKDLKSPTDQNVALFTFPNVTSTTASKDVSCSSYPDDAVNSTPAAGNTTYTGQNPTYQIVGFSSDYRTSNGATALNPSSNLVKAVGQLNFTTEATTVNGCLAAQGSSQKAPAGTYLAGVIYAANSALIAQNAVHSAKNNAIVILTDGNSNATNDYGSPINNMMATTWVNTSGTTKAIDSNGLGVYPSNVGACGQEVAAGQYVQTSSINTLVFAIAYGAMTTGSWNPGGLTLTGTDSKTGKSNYSENIVGAVNASACPTDQDGFFTQFALGANVSTAKNLDPCKDIQNLTTPYNPNTLPPSVYFYSDPQGSTASPCVAPNSSATTLDKIFAAIVGQFGKTPRLIPNGTT